MTTLRSHFPGFNTAAAGAPAELMIEPLRINPRFCLSNYLSGSTPPKSTKRNRLPRRAEKKVQADPNRFLFLPTFLDVGSGCFRTSKKKRFFLGGGGATLVDLPLPRIAPTVVTFGGGASSATRCRIDTRTTQALRPVDVFYLSRMQATASRQQCFFFKYRMLFYQCSCSSFLFVFKERSERT